MLNFKQPASTMRDDIAWLKERDFAHVGTWVDHDTKLSAPTLDRVPGIYVYVVQNRIRYLGKAARLRSRVRSYNRALGAETSRIFRKVHNSMRSTWKANDVIDVWAYRLKGTDGPLLCLETKWIKELRPEWNGT
jgi:excinuclease UvrABC nuclease subunit